MKNYHLLICIFCLCSGQLLHAQKQSNGLSIADELAIRQIITKYTQAWLKNDSAGVLAHFEEEARLAPSGLSPVKGMAEIRKFWFPNDGSTTIIHGFDNDIVEISGEDDMAFCTQKTWLDWSYVKGDSKMGKEQRGYETSVFRRQKTGEWKIWRQAWTDVWSRQKTDAEAGLPSEVKNNWKATQPAIEYNAALAQKLGADDYGMKKYVLVLLKTGPATITDKPTVDSLFTGHMANIMRLADAGKLALAGPIGPKEKYRGIFIFNVETVDAAKELTETDPAIKSGLLEAEFMPWYGSAAVLEIPEMHKSIQKVKF